MVMDGPPPKIFKRWLGAFSEKFDRGEYGAYITGVVTLVSEFYFTIKEERTGDNIQFPPLDRIGNPILEDGFERLYPGMEIDYRIL